MAKDKKFLKDTNEVVLDFPYKDCVLVGGQSTEESLDNYFEYDETITKAQEKQGLKAQSYNQKTAKRKEIFFNQTLAKDEIDRLYDPKALTNWKRFFKDGEQEVQEIKRDEEGTIKENLIIKGENLLALHSLKKQFAGKVKLIYIDPPYNTGNAGFKYNDNFSRSSWLTFMKNRLEVARELLSRDGIIIISCDDNEQAYLKILCDDIFNEENILSTQHIQVRYSNKTLNEKNDWQPVMEYALIYAKNENLFKANRPTIEYSIDKFIYEIKELSEGTKIEIKGRKVNIYKKGEWEIIKHEAPAINLLKETWVSGSIYSGTGNGTMVQNVIEPRVKIDGYGSLYKIDGLGEDGLGYRYFTAPQKVGAIRSKMFSGVPTKKIEEIKSGTAIKYESISNFHDYSPDFGNIRHEGGFAFNSGKKPVKMLKQFLNYHKDKNAIVLDFYAGSGTTAHAVLELNKEDGGNRKFIMIEQMDFINTVTCPRVQKVMEKENIKDSFIYFELAKWNETAKEKILACESLDQLIKFFDEMYERYFLNYNLKIKEFREKVIKEEELKNLTLEEQKKMFITMLYNNQMYVNKTEMADSKYGIDKKSQNLTELFYKK
jgi:adenine-specific DNA-methyltransferase